MAELTEQAKGLKQELGDLTALFRGLGRDVSAARGRLHTIRGSRNYQQMSERMSVIHQIDSLNSRIEQYRRVAKARMAMATPPGKFSSSEQAIRFQERMKQFTNPSGYAQDSYTRMYGEQGGREVREAEARENFRRDTMDDFDRRKEDLTARYGGNAMLAEQKLIREALKGLPDFFKKFNMSAKDLSSLSKTMHSIPGVGGVMEKFEQLKDATAKGKIGGAATAVDLGVKLAKFLYDGISKRAKDVLQAEAMAAGSGMDSTEMRSSEKMLSALGGNVASTLSLSRSWKTNVGNLLSGKGTADFLSEYARYGIDVTGKGAGGLATDKQIKARVAGKIKEFYDSGEEERALSLKQAAQFDDAMYFLALKEGSGINGPLIENKKDYEDVQRGVGVKYKMTRGENRVKSWFNKWAARAWDFVTLNANEFKDDRLRPGESEEQRRKRLEERVRELSRNAKERKEIKAAEGSYTKPEKVRDAAVSLAAYERNGGYISAAEKTGGAITNNKTVAFNIGTVDVNANNVREFMESVEREGNSRLNSIDVLEWADSGVKA